MVSVDIDIRKENLRYWDESQARFINPKGTYTFMVGASSDDIRLSQQIAL